MRYLGRERLVFLAMKFVGLVQLCSCFLLAPHGSVEATQPPVGIHFGWIHLNGPPKCRDGIIAPTGIGVENS